ncbi:MAG TPA: hypothetical protein VK632_01970 [Verrucomicrobiae bacterium]|nr:hypothetical protein [Verrucomicrobiae bacterium]
MRRNILSQLRKLGAKIDGKPWWEEPDFWLYLSHLKRAWQAG